MAFLDLTMGDVLKAQDEAEVGTIDAVQGAAAQLAVRGFDGKCLSPTLPACQVLAARCPRRTPRGVQAPSGRGPRSAWRSLRES
jgi:hypothetical protein